MLTDFRCLTNSSGHATQGQSSIRSTLYRAELPSRTRNFDNSTLEFAIYVDLFQEYMEPLRRNTDKITEQEISEIFMNIEYIRTLTRGLLAALEERLYLWEEDGQDHLGDILGFWV